MTKKTEQPTAREVAQQRLVGLSLESLCAEIYQYKNWHNLSFAEEMLVERLEKSGHLRPCSQGFVGGATSKPNTKDDSPPIGG